MKRAGRPEPPRFKAVVVCAGRVRPFRFYGATPTQLTRRVLVWRHRKPEQDRPKLQGLVVYVRDGGQWQESVTWTWFVNEALDGTEHVGIQQPPMRKRQAPKPVTGPRCGPVTVTNTRTGRTETWRPYTAKQVAAMNYGTVRRPRRRRAG